MTTAHIDSFERHGADFWNRRGPYRTLHHINPARLQFIERFVKLAGASVLDIGCGGGILSEALAERGARVTGIDLSGAVLAAARAHRDISGLNIDYRQQSSADCVAAGEHYDHITCLEVLEHVQDPAAIIADIAQLLRPGGHVFFSTLNRTFKARAGAIWAAEGLGLVPRGTHQFDFFLKPAELVRMVERAGLTPLELCGLDYHPLCGTARLSRRLDINYLLAARK